MNCQKQAITTKSEGTKLTAELGIYPVYFKGFGSKRKHSVYLCRPRPGWAVVTNIPRPGWAMVTKGCL